MKVKDFLYGAVIKLTREDTLDDIERNFEKMKQAGLDTAVVWPSCFWWEEKKEGYPFNTGKELLKIADRIGIKVIMELAGQLPMMEYIPDFQMKDEYYCTDENGHKRLVPNSFGWLNYFHPEVNSLICDNFKQTALAYKDYPALVAYDVFNETAFNSFDEYTMAEFRKWLMAKYKTIDRLNDVWEHTYTDFSQVGYAPWMWMSVMPLADLGAFRREAVAIFVRRWCDAIRSVDNTHPLIADNIGSMITNGHWFYERPQDDFVLKDAVDEIGMSFYPKQVKGTQSIQKRWLAFDSFYAASAREGFYISEMQTHIQAMFNPTTAVRPYELKQWCCEALASGAKGLIYWMWRPFTKGLQTAGRGLVDYRERSTPRLEFATELASIISDMGTLSPVRSKVGILFDPMCQDLQILYTKCYSVDQNIYLNSLCGAYGAMLDAGVRADIVRIDEIDNYDMIILSNHIMLGKREAEALERFVRGGGVLVCDGKIGIVDESSMLNAILPGGDANKLMGLEYVDTDYVDMDFVLDGVTYRGYYGKEITELLGGECIAKFDDGTPAIVKNSVADGCTLTINTHLWYSYENDPSSAVAIAAKLADTYGLRDISASAPLRVRMADGGEWRYAFVFNYTENDVSGHILGGGFDDEVALGANEIKILKVRRA